MKFYPVLIGLLGFSVASAQSAPFGLVLGMSADDLRRIGAKPIENAPGFWDLEKPPIPNSNFSGYLLTASQTQGLCKITGLGITLKNDSSGDKAREKYKELSGIITQRYGKSTRDFDYLSSGSIWNRSNDFAMAVSKDERSLASYWLDVKNPTVKNISVTVKALSSSDTYVNVSYELNNFDACLTEIKSINGDGM